MVIVGHLRTRGLMRTGVRSLQAVYRRSGALLRQLRISKTNKNRAIAPLSKHRKDFWRNKTYACQPLRRTRHTKKNLCQKVGRQGIFICVPERMHTQHTYRVPNALVKQNLQCHTSPVPTTKTRKEISYPLSFRVPLSQVEEIDGAVFREKRKRRSDLLEAIWEIAWADYRKSGSLMAYAQGKRTRKYSRRVSEELQDQLYTAVEMIMERAPSAVIEELARKLTQWAGKYAQEK